MSDAANTETFTFHLDISSAFDGSWKIHCEKATEPQCVKYLFKVTFTPSPIGYDSSLKSYDLERHLSVREVRKLLQKIDRLIGIGTVILPINGKDGISYDLEMWYGQKHTIIQWWQKLPDKYKSVWSVVHYMQYLARNKTAPKW